MKVWGVPGRPRLFEVIQRVNAINAVRLSAAPGHAFAGESCLSSEVKADPSRKLSYLVAPPQMARYVEYSTRIYRIYIKYVDPKDIHVYSIDEVFIDATEYLAASGLSARDFAMQLILDVLRTTGITADARRGRLGNDLEECCECSG